MTAVNHPLEGGCIFRTRLNKLIKTLSYACTLLIFNFIETTSISIKGDAGFCPQHPFI